MDSWMEGLTLFSQTLPINWQPLKLKFYLLPTNNLSLNIEQCPTSDLIINQQIWFPEAKAEYHVAYNRGL